MTFGGSVDLRKKTVGRSMTPAFAIVSLMSGEATKSLAFFVPSVSNKMTTSFLSADERNTRGLVRPADFCAGVSVEHWTPFAGSPSLYGGRRVPWLLLPGTSHARLRLGAKNGAVRKRRRLELRFRATQGLRSLATLRRVPFCEPLSKLAPKTSLSTALMNDRCRRWQRASGPNHLFGM